MAVVVDDGETLTPLEVKPLTVAAFEFAKIAPGFMQQWLSAIQADVDKAQQTQPPPVD
jgi:hypothetical protein